MWVGFAPGVVLNLSPPHFHKDDPRAGMTDLWRESVPCSATLTPCWGRILGICDLGQSRPGAVSHPHPEAHMPPLCPLSYQALKAPTRADLDPSTPEDEPRPRRRPHHCGGPRPFCPWHPRVVLLPLPSWGKLRATGKALPSSCRERVKARGQALQGPVPCWGLFS